MMTEAFVRWLYFYGIILLKHNSMNYISMNYDSIKKGGHLYVSTIYWQKRRVICSRKTI